MLRSHQSALTPNKFSCDVKIKRPLNPVNRKVAELDRLAFQSE